MQEIAKDEGCPGRTQEQKDAGDVHAVVLTPGDPSGLVIFASQDRGWQMLVAITTQQPPPEPCFRNRPAICLGSGPARSLALQPDLHKRARESGEWGASLVFPQKRTSERAQFTTTGQER